MGVSLGNITLDGFEVATRIGFGGKQALAVHKLPGGSRVIDAMGADDDAIAWRGILSGADAAVRARLLDGLRAAGTPIRLAWDVFSATVIVSELRLDFQNSWWIPYQIACTVLVGTQPADTANSVVDSVAAIVADLAAIGPAYASAGLVALVSASGATIPGSQANAVAANALDLASMTISSDIVGAELQLSAADLPTLAQAAGSLAMLTNATGYIGRAIANFGIE